jgi:alkylated DNA repair dioxygenase AlkB
MADLLSNRYDVAFDSVGANLYRDGRDSVAWHGDRVLRTVAVATVAIVSLGAPRRFLLRPRGGGRSIVHRLGPGDLLVMGGTCQRTWQHCVPKSANPVGPRISVTFRHAARPGHRRRAPGEATR